MTDFDVVEQAVSGVSPVGCYEFYQGERRWLYTSADEDITLPGVGLFRQELISSGDIQHDSESGTGGIEVYVPRTSPIPALFKSPLPPQPVGLRIYVAHRDTPDDFRAWWPGRITAAAPRDGQTVLTGISLIQLLQNDVSGMDFGPTCRHPLFGAGCGVVQANFTDQATLSGVSGANVTSGTFAARADGWYRGGKFYPPNGAPILITAHVGSTLTLQRAPGLASGALVRATAGCDWLFTTCHSKFGNAINFVGWPWRPGENPFTQRVF